MDERKHPSHAREFWIVFVLLVVFTAVEVAITFTALNRSLINVVLVVLMIAKFALVAAFYMHLKYDARLYTYIFVLPILMIAAFAYILLI